MKEQHAGSPAWFETPKERKRYYLFAGMGGRAARRKHRLFLQWSIAIGLLVSLMFAAVLYLLNNRYR